MIQKSKEIKFGKAKKATYGTSPKKMKSGGAGKPDYIDIDGDGNKSEPMKDAAKDKKTPKAGMKAGYGKTPMKAKSGKSPMKDRRKKK